MSDSVRFENLPGLVGREFGPGEVLVVDQERVTAFADATDDHQWIHVDAARAADGPFGGTVAHGYLTLSLLVRLVQELGALPTDADLIVNYGLDKLRFPAPLRTGSGIRLKATLASVAPKGAGRYLLTLRCEVVPEDGGTPVLVADVLYLAIKG